MHSEYVAALFGRRSGSVRAALGSYASSYRATALLASPADDLPEGELSSRLFIFSPRLFLARSAAPPLLLLLAMHYYCCCVDLAAGRRCRPGAARSAAGAWRAGACLSPTPARRDARSTAPPPLSAPPGAAPTSPPPPAEPESQHCTGARTEVSGGFALHVAASPHMANLKAGTAEQP
jgi:hypothetical protein